ncbi:MAG: CsiV family protein [Gammaproteobacteria bacterium]
MKLHVARFAALIATVCGGPAVAQPSATPTPPLYQVEIIVLANRDFDAGEERFPQDLAPLRANQTESLLDVPLYVEPSPPSTPDQATALTQVAPADDPLAFRMLTPDQLQLNAEYRKLTNSGAYRAVLHAGWVQPGLPEDRAKPFDLTLLGVTNPRGNVRVYLSRFLHVSLDISYQDGAAAAVAPEPIGDELREITFAPRYRLTTERQTRSGELHYFDHPAFGVLVKVTPVQPANSNSTGRRPAA